MASTINEAENGLADLGPKDAKSAGTADIEVETPVLIVGGGPVGMLLAYALSAYHGQPCVLVEQSPTTTTYPKMELTQGRAMEIYRWLGLADELRALGVPESEHLDEVISTGLGEDGHIITVWKRDSPAEIRRKSERLNDGTLPREPYLRCHQIPIEKWLKEKISKEEKVASFWGWKFLGLDEKDTEVISEAMDANGRKLKIKSAYVVGCDGAGSIVRRSAGLEGPRTDLAIHMAFIHFESTDFDILHSQGKFWHLLMMGGSIIVDQGAGIWTLHRIVAPGVDDASEEDPLSVIAEVVGGLSGPRPINVDRILVQGKWGTLLSIASGFRSEKGRVFLTGDSGTFLTANGKMTSTDKAKAHPLSPMGGHGLNTGICDLWDISWKLAAVLSGWGGPRLLHSYDIERRPIALANAAMVNKAAVEVAVPILTAADRVGAAQLTAKDEAGQRTRDDLAKEADQGHWLHNQTNKLLGYRYNSPIIIQDEDGTAAPVSEDEITKYLPTSWPGGRPPHVFLADGKTSIFDLFGKGFSLVDFSASGQLGKIFSSASSQLSVPLEVIHLPQERHVRDLWERDVVLVRPDGHVAWRSTNSEEQSLDIEAVTAVLNQVRGMV
ncbi:hypothetical protein LTR84_013022 [Exophiala bonariae]|uniref:FAD-binding domain-containing protein n=1 Tax=Exophiala bonariae TaxID=1690606 RepID=A0AAV9NEU3_9EURO|nr:hypothetical protein LTR84_013022 [Exophiala bonariae]